ncbi:MAG: GNAT family N-acetyltransferase [Eubacteriales bacterium]
MKIRAMAIEDYEEVFALWERIRGFAIRSIDDSKESIEAFLRRNPSTSMVAIQGGEVVGSVLCGHDGRLGSLYHVCVDSAYRKQGIGSAMVTEAVVALEQEGISKVCLIAFTNNQVGNTFWRELKWQRREDINYYEKILNKNNKITYVT